MYFNKNISILEKSALCERVKYLRQSFNISANELAKRLCCEPMNVYDVENQREAWSDTMLKLISYEFGVSMNWLKTGVPEENDCEIVKNYNKITCSSTMAEETIYNNAIYNRHELYSYNTINKSKYIVDIFENRCNIEGFFDFEGELDEYGLDCYDDGFHQGFQYAAAFIRGMLGISDIPEEPPKLQ